MPTFIQPNPTRKTFSQFPNISKCLSLYLCSFVSISTMFSVYSLLMFIKRGFMSMLSICTTTLVVLLIYTASLSQVVRVRKSSDDQRATSINATRNVFLVRLGKERIYVLRVFGILRYVVAHKTHTHTHTDTVQPYGAR